MDVIMPQLGETVTEGTVANWYKKVGDAVKADEPLFEVETDKVTTEIRRLRAACSRRSWSSRARPCRWERCSP